jgi:hypothetical protein
MNEKTCQPMSNTLIQDEGHCSIYTQRHGDVSAAE